MKGGAHERESHQRESRDDHDAALSDQGGAGRQGHHSSCSCRATRAALRRRDEYDGTTARGRRMSRGGMQ